MAHYEVAHIENSLESRLPVDPGCKEHFAGVPNKERLVAGSGLVARNY